MRAHSDPNFLRRVIFTPYLRGKGPRFVLDTWDGGGYYRGGPQHRIRYALTERTPGAKPAVLFEGADFGCSPLDSIDGDGCIRALMGFLTLKKGDTDADYFEKYTERQLQFTREHAEALSCEVAVRFGED
jgi:hypothetical protein